MVSATKTRMENYLFGVLLDRSTEKLHEIFIDRWNYSKAIWDETSESGLKLLPFVKNLNSNQKDLIIAGKSKEWDITLLSKILLESTGWNNRIDFEKDNGDDINEALKLREQGNAVFKQGHYVLSIEYYCEAIICPNVSNYDRAILYANRAISYLHLFDIKPGSRDYDNLTDYESELLEKWTSNNNLADLALQDSERSIEYRPDWWKGYFRKASALEKLEEYEKAVVSYRKAKVLEKSSTTSQAALDNLKHALSKKQRQEHLTPLGMPSEFSEKMENLHKKTGGMLNVNTAKFLLSAPKGALPPGCSDALRGHQFRDGDNNIPQDYAKAARYYSKAASVGNADGLYSLAHLTLNGYGVTKNIVGAIALLEKAATQPPILEDFHNMPNTGVAEAQHSIGLLYADGVGYDKDTVMAAYWYEKASKNGSKEAAHNLGLFYLHGQGMEKDLVKAEQYLKLASCRGNSSAMIDVAYVYLHQFDFARANRMFSRAIKAGSTLALMGETQFQKTLKEKTEFFDSLEIHDKYDGDLTNYEKYERFFNESYKGKFKLKDLEKSLSLSDADKLPSYFKPATHSLDQKFEELQAIEHFFNAELTFETDLNLWVTELATCYTLDHTVADLSPERKADFLKALKAMLKNVLQSVLGMSDFEANISFLDECIRIFPTEVFFWNMRGCMKAFLKRYEDGLIDINQCIKLEPERYDYLYDKAELLCCIVDKFNFSKVFSAFEDFLKMAPLDHRKVPECYYAMAKITIMNSKSNMKDTEEMLKIKDLYEKGLNAEESQLPFFIPYESMKKKSLAFISPIFDTLNEKLDNSAVVSPTSKASPTSSKLSFLSDPYRMEIIVTHREKNAQFAKAFNAFQDPGIFTTSWKPPKTQSSNFNSASTSIDILEMDPQTDLVYHNRYVDVTVFDTSLRFIPSISLLVFDKRGTMQRLFLYGFPKEEGFNLICHVFTPGRKLKIFNPYHRLCNDDKPAIRVDDPHTIVKLELGSNMCRACGQLNSKFKWAKCKTACYCSAECQSFDWKEYRHRLVCGKGVPNSNTQQDAEVVVLSHSQ